MENVGLAATTNGCILGILLIIFGGSLYLIESKRRVMTAVAIRILGIGIFTIMVSILFSIPNQLLTTSTSDESNVFGAIIISVFLGSPLLFMGVAIYIGLNAKAQQILNSATVPEN